MVKVNRIVITKKEEKALKTLSRLFEIMGVDLDSLIEKVNSQEKEIESLNKEIVVLKDELKSSKEENIQFIKDSMSQIYINVQKANEKVGVNNKPGFSFEGKKINEEY